MRPSSWLCPALAAALLGAGCGPSDREAVSWARSALPPGVPVIAEGPQAGAIARACGGRAVASVSRLDPAEIASASAILLDSRCSGSSEARNAELRLALDSRFVPAVARLGWHGRVRLVLLVERTLLSPAGGTLPVDALRGNRAVVRRLAVMRAAGVRP